MGTNIRFAKSLLPEEETVILTLPGKIYISSANVDMRKSIDGLVSVVEDSFNCSASDEILFVFHNKYCYKIKLLYMNKEGFCLSDIITNDAVTGHVKCKADALSAGKVQFAF